MIERAAALYAAVKAVASNPQFPAVAVTAVLVTAGVLWGRRWYLGRTNGQAQKVVADAFAVVVPYLAGLVVLGLALFAAAVEPRPWYETAATLLGELDAVRDRVLRELNQRIVETVGHSPINRQLTAARGDPHPLALLVGEAHHGAREPIEQRAHAGTTQLEQSASHLTRASLHHLRAAPKRRRATFGVRRVGAQRRGRRLDTRECQRVVSEQP